MGKRNDLHQLAINIQKLLVSEYTRAEGDSSKFNNEVIAFRPGSFFPLRAPENLSEIDLIFPSRLPFSSELAGYLQWHGTSPQFALPRRVLFRPGGRQVQNRCMLLVPFR